MSHKTETEYIIFTVFLIGIISAVYYIISVVTVEIDLSAILEKTILTGIIVAILIILAIVLFKEIELRDKVEALREFGVAKPAGKRTAKDVKRDMMRIYRDMGALKIVVQDKIIDQQTYNKEKKELDENIKTLKKELEKFEKK